MTKIIFLDVDGVLNGMPKTWDKNPGLGTYQVDEDNVKWLEYLVLTTDATIVMSSTWRNHADHMDFLKSKVWFLEQRLHKDWRTVSLWNRVRGAEIADWLEDHPDVTDWVILDDDGDMLPDQLLNFVQTDYRDGLTEALANRAVEILS